MSYENGDGKMGGQEGAQNQKKVRICSEHT